MNGAFGHIDFYPNGGYNQPNCMDNLFPFVCSHGESCQMYIDSINNPNGGCIVTKCNSESDYINGHNNCGNIDSCKHTSACNIMGWGSFKPETNSKAENESNLYYLTTKTSAPYC